MDKNLFSHIESIVIVITLFGGYFMIDSKFDTINSRFDSINSRFDQFLIAQHEESKDFHCRLALQDMEFKMRLCAIEERNNGK